MNDVAVLVAEHLDFDMARIFDEFLDEHPLVAEGVFGLRARAGESFRHLGLVARDAHALAAAAGGRLDHDRIADLGGDPLGVVRVGDNAEMARDGRNLGFGRRCLRRDLVAHQTDGVGIGTDEDDAGFRQCDREGFAFGEKTVAGMHRFRAGAAAGGDDLLDREITFRRGWRADGHRLISHRDVQRVFVGVGINGDRLDPEAAGGLDDTAGDFAAIGDQDTLEHSASGRAKWLCGGSAELSMRAGGR